MDSFKCLAGLDDGNVVTFDGIAYQDKLWLVISWLETLDKSKRVPERIIRFDDRPYQKSNQNPYRYVNIQLPVSAADLHGKIPQGIEFLDHPHDLVFPSH